MDPTRNTALEGGAPGRPRLLIVDAARGAAVIAMAVYHSAWDLTDLNLIETDITQSPGWQWFARLVAATFLVLVGIGLALAHRDAVRTVPFLRRVAMVAAAAAVITLVTVFAFPESYIFFGVLHNITLSSLLALPLLRAPAWLVALIAAICLAAPLWLAGPAFDAPLLAWLGLGVTVPVTNDYVPFLPWTGFVFAGLAAGRLWLARTAGLPAPTGSRPLVGRVLAAIGRRSLAIYLLHQPLIFGLLWSVAQLTGPNPVAEAAPFVRNCVVSCRAVGRQEGECQAYCACTVEGLRREGIWAAYIRGKPNVEQVGRSSEIARACLPAGG